MTPRWNVLDEPSLYVVRGKSEAISLRDVLCQAQDITSLALQNPFAIVGCLRWLVALIMDATGAGGSEQRWQRAWRAGRFDREVLERYFQQYHDRFDLFDPVAPLGQVAGLQPLSGGPKPASSLWLAAASGNNVPLFGVVTEGDSVIIPMDRALECLVGLQGYDTAAIKTGAQGDPVAKAGKTTGNPTGPLGQIGAVLPWGTNLFETIMLNISISREVANDRPVWRRNLTPQWEIRQPVGILEYLTWPSRRVRMIPDENGSGVGAAVITAGDRLNFIPPGLEPHTRWRQSKGHSSVAVRPVRWQPGQSAWRGLPSLLALNSADGDQSSRLLGQSGEQADEIGETYPLSLLCVGVTYGNQSAVIEDVFSDELPIPIAALRASGNDAVREALIDVAERADKIRIALNNLDDNIRLAQGGDKTSWDVGRHPGNDAMALITTPTMRLLKGLQREPEQLIEGLLAWDITVEHIAWRTADYLLDQVPPMGFAGCEIGPADRKRWLRPADAEAWFRKALREALPHLARNQQNNSQSGQAHE